MKHIKIIEKALSRAGLQKKDIAQEQSLWKSILSGAALPSFHTSSFLELLKKIPLTEKEKEKVIVGAWYEKFGREIGVPEKEIRNAVEQVAKDWENVPAITEFIDKKKRKWQQETGKKTGYFSEVAGGKAGLLRRIYGRLAEKNYIEKQSVVEFLYRIYGRKILPALIKATMDREYLNYAFKNKKEV